MQRGPEGRTGCAWDVWPVENKQPRLQGAPGKRGLRRRAWGAGIGQVGEKRVCLWFVNEDVLPSQWEGAGKTEVKGCVGKRQRRLLMVPASE